MGYQWTRCTRCIATSGSPLYSHRTMLSSWGSRVVVRKCYRLRNSIMVDRACHHRDLVARERSMEVLVNTFTKTTTCIGYRFSWSHTICDTRLLSSLNHRHFHRSQTLNTCSDFMCSKRAQATSRDTPHGEPGSDISRARLSPNTLTKCE